MSRPAIVKKLNDLFFKNETVTEESQIVYLMVEVRKYLDQWEDGKGYKLLRFYCDWIVHTQKDRNVEHISGVVDELYDMAVCEIQESEQKSPDFARAFMRFEALRGELGHLFQKIGIQTKIVERNEQWKEFTMLMANVLVDQPIVKPTDKVLLFAFELTEKSSLIGRIEFAQPIVDKLRQKHTTYRFSMAEGPD